MRDVTFCAPLHQGMMTSTPAGKKPEERDLIVFGSSPALAVVDIRARRDTPPSSHPSRDASDGEDGAQPPHIARPVLAAIEPPFLVAIDERGNPIPLYELNRTELGAEEPETLD